VEGSEIITLAVPPTVDATYVVALAARPADADPANFQNHAIETLAEPSRQLARRMSEGGLLAVHSGPMTSFPPLPVRFLRAMGARAEDMAALERATFGIAVYGEYRPGWPPAHDWAARAVASSLARRLNGVLVDLHIPVVLVPDRAARSLPGADEQTGISDWVCVLQSSGDRGSWFTTRGLARFGLPELQTLDVPPMFVNPWTAVLTGIARRLLDVWVELLGTGDRPAFVELPAELEIGEPDIARAYGRTPTEGGRARVRLRLDPAEDLDNQTFLTVVPPNDFPASAGEHVTAVCDELIGLPTDEIRHAATGAAMEAAIGTARASLPVARERFLADSFPPRARLIVKHDLHVDEEHEYVWATVTSWPEPELIVGTCMNDAHLDRRIRVGRPVRIDVATVVDWALWIDGEGIVEGGWTNRVLHG
jgi:hypothetical protein